MFDRRRFLQQASATAIALPAVSSLIADHLPAADEVLPKASQAITGKSDRLMVYDAKIGEIETPLAVLREHRVTPKELLFIRNNQILPGARTLQAGSLTDWTVKLSGLIDSPQTIRGDELAKLDQTDIEMVLQCSGNGRSKFAKGVKADGVQWQNGAMGNIQVRGVRLRRLIEALGIRIAPNAKFVTAEGQDAPHKVDAADFEHSLPLNDALDRSLLVLSLNGEPLPLAHGGPVRIMTPGYYATMNVKWLSRLHFEATESANYHHMPRYRTPKRPIEPGTKFTYSHENSDPNWDMKIRSVIFAPLDNETIAAGPFEIRGVAWNDGQAKLDSVEVSFDNGRTWRRAELEPSKSPFAWHHWKLTVPFASGQTTIHSRAVDVLGRAQPLDGTIHWNQPGYAWNGADEIQVTVR